MLSQELLDMVKETFTKYGPFIPPAHLTSVVHVCSSLVSDPNQGAYTQLDGAAFNYAVAAHISSHWVSQSKFNESKLKTAQAKAGFDIRKQANLNKEKLTVGDITTMVALDEKVNAAQYSADVSNELAQVSKTLSMAVRMQHESLIERTRSERAENKITQ